MEIEARVSELYQQDRVHVMLEKGERETVSKIVVEDVKAEQALRSD